MKEKFYLQVVERDESGKEVKRAVEVSEEIYREYMRSVWREENHWKLERYGKSDREEREKSDEEKYAFDRVRMPRVVSLESVIESGGTSILPSQEDFAARIAEEMELQEKIEILRELMLSFTEKEKDLYQHLFVEQMSERTYAKMLNVSRPTVAWRKEKLLQRLKKEFLKKNK